ncbi:MAG TPA: hypothetical protein VH419_08335, partial [Nocardioidaceae bacterium]
VPEPRTYQELFDADVAVRDPGNAWQGLRAWSAEERTAIELGVRATVVDVVTCRALTIVEVDFTNPPAWPDHCPSRSTFVHHLEAGRSRQVSIYYHA